jgi:hypothetical protein
MINKIFESSLTPEEINENIYWMSYISENLPELGLSFQKTKYEVVPISKNIIEFFPFFATYISSSRTSLLNSYFISKDNTLSWEEVQSKLGQNSTKARLWFDHHSMLRGNKLNGLVTRLKQIKKYGESLLERDSKFNDDSYKVKVLNVLSNIDIPVKNNEVINSNLNERIKLVHILLETNYKLLTDLDNI